jgi:multidrug efflux pump subunit AcrB
MKSRRWLLAVSGVALVAILGLLAGLGYFVTQVLRDMRMARAARGAPTIVVEASYPGANARVVADTVAAPIEQQVNGVENLLHLRSSCGKDGAYTLAITFASGTDLNVAQVLVQNRIALAQPILPEAVVRTGVSVRKKSPAVIALLVLTSPAGRFDEVHLSNYAAKVRDEMLRLPGVGDVALLGQRNFSIHIWLDPDKLAARGLTSGDVVKALGDNDLQPAGGVVGAADGKAFGLTATSLGRLQAPEDLGKIVVKTAPEGAVVYLRDIARVELGTSGEVRSARFDGRPAVALAIHMLGPGTDAKSFDAALQTLLQWLRAELPEGLDLDTTFDFHTSAAPDALLVDVELPAGASGERVSAVLEQCGTLIRTIDGVTRTLTTTDDPFAAPRLRPCILVGIAPGKRADRQKIAADLRTRLGSEIAGAAVRVNDLASPGRATPGGYPIAFAVADVSGSGYEALVKRAERIRQRLSENSLMSDVGTSPSVAAAPQIQIDIDRQKATAMGVAISDIQRELQIALGGVAVGSAGLAGRAWQVTVRGGEFRRDAESLKHLMVTNAKGERIPLGTLVAIRLATGPAAVERLDMYPMVEISANPAAGVTLAAARALCEKTAAEELGPEFRMAWLSHAAD